MSALVRRILNAGIRFGLPCTRVRGRATKMIQGPEHLMYREKAVPVQPGEEKPWEYFINVYIYLVEGNENMDPSSFQWFPVTGQEAMGTNRNAGNFSST